MSFTVLNRKYYNENITAGTPAGQEINQAQFFPYTPGTGTAGGQNDGEPKAGFENVGQPGSTLRYVPNAEYMGNGQGLTGYGTENEKLNP